MFTRREYFHSSEHQLDIWISHSNEFSSSDFLLELEPHVALLHFDNEIWYYILQIFWIFSFWTKTEDLIKCKRHFINAQME